METLKMNIIIFNETVVLTKKQYLSKTKREQLIHKVYKSPFVFFSIIPIIYFGVIQQFIYIVKKYRRPYVFSQSLLQITVDHMVNNILSFLYLFTIYECGILFHCIIWFSISSSIAFMMFHNQHTFNPSYVVDNNNWSQRDSGIKGSSFIQIPYLLKYFYMGIDYHHIHHMNSKIPGYNLQNYHEEVVSKSTLFDIVITTYG